MGRPTPFVPASAARPLTDLEVDIVDGDAHDLTSAGLIGPSLRGIERDAGGRR
jgi:hypothetical protein